MGTYAFKETHWESRRRGNIIIIIIMRAACPLFISEISFPPHTHRALISPPPTTRRDEPYAQPANQAALPFPKATAATSENRSYVCRLLLYARTQRSGSEEAPPERVEGHFLVARAAAALDFLAPPPSPGGGAGRRRRV